MSDNLPTIEFPAAIVDLKYPLMRLRQALGGKGPVRFLAMGSSSTAGRGDVVPYPYRLEMYLRQYFKDVVQRPHIRIDVLNRGRGEKRPLKNSGASRPISFVMIRHWSSGRLEPTLSFTTTSTTWMLLPGTSGSAWRNCAPAASRFW
jgi:hypothetical protein